MIMGAIVNIIGKTYRTIKIIYFDTEQHNPYEL